MSLVKRYCLIVPLFLLIHEASSQIKCDCTITPYKPDACKKPCLGALLQTTDTLELSLVVGLNQSLTQKIFEIRERHPISNIDSLKKYVSKQEFETIFKSLNDLNKAQLNYLNTPLEKRKTILAEWKHIDLNKRPS